MHIPNIKTKFKIFPTPKYRSRTKTLSPTAERSPRLPLPKTIEHEKRSAKKRTIKNTNTIGIESGLKK